MHMNVLARLCSGMVAGWGMFVAVVAASPVIEIVPVGSLTGVLFMVVLHTFNWATFRMIIKLRKSDAFGIVLVSVVAVLTNLAVAVGLGVIWSALVISWDNGEVEARTYEKTINGETVPNVRSLPFPFHLFFCFWRCFVFYIFPCPQPK